MQWDGLLCATQKGQPLSHTQPHELGEKGCTHDTAVCASSGSLLECHADLAECRV